MIRKIAGALLLAIVIFYGLGGIVDVDPGESAIVVKKLGADKGMQPGALDTGMHWRDPIYYDVFIYDVRFHQETMEDVPAQTKDGHPITVDISFEIGLQDDMVPQLHETVGKSYFKQIVFPAARAAIRNATANQLSDAVYTGEGRAAIQGDINDKLEVTMGQRGILITTNMRELEFQNADFVKTLEEKAKAAQREEIERRYAAAAEQEAIKVANVAEGQKQKRIKAAEAEREELRLQGEGERLQKEEQAKGLLAMVTAEAEGVRLRREALSGRGGAELVSIAWAENLGPNVKVYGFPTGAPGTSSIIDVNSVLQNAMTGGKQ